VKSLEKPYLPLALTLLVVAALWLFDVTRALDRDFFDSRIRAEANPALVPANGAVVLIDEDSLRTIGERHSVRWPWPRSFFAALIASLHQAGAKKIVMDFEFLEPSAPEQDDVLAAYAAACPEVVLGRTRDKGPVFWTPEFQRQYPSFAVSNRTGLVDFAPDADHVYRRYRVPGSLASKAMESAPAQPDLLLRWYASIETTNPAVRISSSNAFSAAAFVVVGLPILGEVAKKGDDTDPAVVAQALATLPAVTVPGEDVRGKVVFVGANAAGTMDLKTTPLARVEPGAMVHFMAWANAERGDYLRPLPPIAGLLAGILLATTLIAIGWRHTSAVSMAIAGVVMIVVMFAGSCLAFRANLFFAPTLPIVSVAIALLAGTTHNFWRERKRKREIQDIFGSYVSKQVVEKLLKDPDTIRLGGEKKELTVFFSDLAGFTDLSEKLSPEELVEVVNRYLAAVTDFILDNNGYVDKYIGDAVMGVFGSPEPIANHALSACRAALATRDWMAKAFAESPVKLRARIGLNTGMMVVGNVGSERKKNFTVLGDAVNLASRLEAANKDVGTLVLIGEDTERMVRGHFLVRPIARLRVKGKQQPNQVYELVSEAGKTDADTKEFVQAYTAAYENFLKKEFAAARAQFAHAKVIRPDDPMTQLYLDKAMKFEYEGLTPDWDVLELKTK
jgi:adenylate cyclase